jgi:hypothetical protein
MPRIFGARCGEAAKIVLKPTTGLQQAEFKLNVFRHF